MHRAVLVAESVDPIRRSLRLRRVAVEGQTAPIFITEIPPGNRDWKLISVAHEEGDLNDIRAILGNDTAIAAYREGKLPFPDGAIIARIAWSHDPSDENDKTFGRTRRTFYACAPSRVRSMWRAASSAASSGVLPRSRATT
jgi:hypothetical protein